MLTRRRRSETMEKCDEPHFMTIVRMLMPYRRHYTFVQMPRVATSLTGTGRHLAKVGEVMTCRRPKRAIHQAVNLLFPVWCRPANCCLWSG